MGFPGPGRFSKNVHVGSCTYKPPTIMLLPLYHHKASQRGRHDILAVHRGWNRIPLHRLLLLLARCHFTNQKWKTWFPDNSTVVTQKNICIILFFNLYKKWNAGQHAILKRPLISSFFSNSFAKNTLCVHSNLNCLPAQCYLWAPLHEEVMQTF